MENGNFGWKPDSAPGPHLPALSPGLPGLPAPSPHRSHPGAGGASALGTEDGQLHLEVEAPSSPLGGGESTGLGVGGMGSFSAKASRAGRAPPAELESRLRATSRSSDVKHRGQWGLRLQYQLLRVERAPVMDSMALTNEVAMSCPSPRYCIPMTHLLQAPHVSAHFFTGCRPAGPNLTLALGQMSSGCYQLGFCFISDGPDVRALDEPYSLVEAIFTSVLGIHFPEHGFSF